MSGDDIAPSLPFAAGEDCRSAFCGEKGCVEGFSPAEIPGCSRPGKRKQVWETSGAGTGC
ncbi:hypothetical protein B5G29_01445 [Akkermansia muciniphila]|nr:hypothetical protein B5G29_01445 [Akkermansia muciniphila]